ncbi:MAG: zinc ribbon domain-containing protein [Gemmatimonadales bacterium]|nr:zinc ribbon domain-containing protein [Gemmatimonadales bacterium]
MPTYEYECSRCGHLFEEFKPMSAPPRKRCPECRGKVNRLISGGLGIVFKGSGFYANDSRPKKQEAGSEAPAPPSDTGKSESAGNNSSTLEKDKT